MENSIQYKNSGASVVEIDEVAPYPRICAHRGFNSVAPENTMPAFGAAIALGAQEIEFDLWSTADGVIVSCHDLSLERVSNGKGVLTEMTYSQLLELDFGVNFSDKFAGIKICTFEEILQKFASHVIMNIHVKIWDINSPDDKLDEIVGLIKKYGCEKHVYIMTSNKQMHKKIREKYPWLRRCMGAGKEPYQIVQNAIELGAQKIQLFKPYFTKQMIDEAHENGIQVNCFWSDDPIEARKFVQMGVDCILTNDYLAIKRELKI